MNSSFMTTYCSLLKKFLIRHNRLPTVRKSFSLNMSVASVDGIVKPVVTFGVVTDIQYADCDDKPAGYDKSKVRFYRDSLNHIDRAFSYWKEYSRSVNFVLQLGDIIDGLNSALGGSHSAMEKTLEKFENNSSIPTFHTVGNHELYNFNRQELEQLFYRSVTKMNISPEIFTPLKPDSENTDISPVLYYKFCPTAKCKFISLDCFDISVLGHDPSYAEYIQAAAVLRRYHGHDNYPLWDTDDELQGLDVRFQEMNGAVGEKQLQWLEEELTESDKLEQNVIVFGHVNLCPESTAWNCLLWNYDQVMSCFHRHKCVRAYLSGHSHSKGYACDTHDIHYIVFNGIIEAPPDTTSFSTVSVFHDRIEILGHGREESYILSFAQQRFSKTDSNSVDVPGDESVISTSAYSVKVVV